MNEYAYKTTAHIHSLKGEMDEITVLKRSARTTTSWTTRA